MHRVALAPVHFHSMLDTLHQTAQVPQLAHGLPVGEVPYPLFAFLDLFAFLLYLSFLDDLPFLDDFPFFNPREPDTKTIVFVVTIERKMVAKERFIVCE